MLITEGFKHMPLLCWKNVLAFLEKLGYQFLTIIIVTKIIRNITGCEVRTLGISGVHIFNCATPNDG